MPTNLGIVTSTQPLRRRFASGSTTSRLHGKIDVAEDDRIALQSVMYNLSVRVSLKCLDEALDSCL